MVEATKSLSSGILKGGYVVVSPSNYVTIDNNEIIKQKLEEIKEKQLNMVGEGESSEGADGFVEGLDSIQVARLVSDVDEAPEETSNIIRPVDLDKLKADAEAEAEKILQDAKEQAKQILEDAKREGYDQGYQEGSSSATREYEAKNKALEREYSDKMSSLDKQYASLKEELEPMLVDKLAEIYANIIGIELSDSRDIILYLLNKALGGMDSNKHYIIHVSQDDFDTVKDAAEEISKASGILIDNLEIIEDHSLSKNGCMIESDAGIFEVGLDTQLRLLNKQLKILSMQPNE